MKHFILKISAALIMTIVTSAAAWSEINVDVNIGIPLPVPTIVISEPPEFILPSSLGFYVAVGVPHDLYQVDGVYFILKNDRWYQGAYYNGPWKEIKYKKLPKKLRRYDYERIRYYRDEEYRYYKKHHHNYKGQYYRPERVDHHNHRDDDDRHEDRGHKHHDNHGDWNPWEKR